MGSKGKYDGNTHTLVHSFIHLFIQQIIVEYPLCSRCMFQVLGKFISKYNKVLALNDLKTEY